jgi:DNA-binding XRE family transcriptional regulator
MMDNEIQRVIEALKSMAGDGYGGQSQLARKIGVPRQRLNDWLTGRRTPDLNAWLKIQAFLTEGGKKKDGKKKRNSATLSDRDI